MNEPLALDVQHLVHAYGPRKAVDDLALTVGRGEIFALLGPNGSGKTTLFRLISTLARVQSGEIFVFGHSVKTETALVRAQLGVVFQSPSLDPKLTVAENIRCQAALYGLRGEVLAERLDEVATQLGLQDRLHTRAEELSGGLKRRAELAKGILHKPRLLLMDEPSTGLDPAARLDLWHALLELRQTAGVTILLTTHLLEEADKADRIAIMHAGKQVAVGAPGDLRSALGDQVLRIHATQREPILAWLRERALTPQVFEQEIRVMGSAAEVIPPLSHQFGSQIQSLTLGQPSLEDVFVAKTGHRFWNEELKDSTPKKKKARR
ncbi:ABC transporter ATP-binding protein [Aureliella helgolandensis]|uniref:Daunorubicin/doxorubicin resistance ATP-binding protein DrrA n=1 Tax=Aureliella helgolandensis TaxID=2527968 RepID=A0A518GH79_9BACT|nr:ABC transporter ATP-binding protein [Aureliella helgolandensis]QDV27937.1 Daunorubicin/doxorubicin resistance ATP-binding protein DrrA [Aureliella helgolandensis]